MWDCVENLPKALVGAHLLLWIVTYPVDKVICSLNNWGLVILYLFLLVLVGTIFSHIKTSDLVVIIFTDVLLK